MQMFYRKDVFAKHNISSAPQTWEEVLSILQIVNGETSRLSTSVFFFFS